MSKGGGCLCACECPRVGGVFQIDDVTRTMSKGGGAPGVPPIQVQTPPPPGWLATGLCYLLSSVEDSLSRVVKPLPYIRHIFCCEPLPTQQSLTAHGLVQQVLG